MPLEMEIDVPESRQVTLPDSVPVGKVKLTVPHSTRSPRYSNRVTSSSGSGWRSIACCRSC